MKMKSYYVYYHRKGEGKTTFNQMRMRVEAKNAEIARRKAKEKLGKLWTIEKVVRMR